MAVVIDGDTGVSKVQDGVVVEADLANSAVTEAKLAADAVSLGKLSYGGMFQTLFAARTSTQTLAGDSGWVDSFSLAFTVGKECNALFIYSSAASYESGAVQGFARLLLDGTMIGYNSCVAKQSTANSAGSGTVFWDKRSLSAGAHTVKVQLRNSIGGTTWITPYYSVDGQTANTLGVLFYE